MGIPGGYTGGCRGGVIPGTQPAARGEVQVQRSGPRRLLQGAGVGGTWSSDVPAVTHPTTPCGRARFAGWALKPASWPIRARLTSYFYKVSQNSEVSPKYVNKASLSPYIQNGSQKSPLGILGFPYSLAFSHKELMTLFWAYGQLYCQNDEVSPGCTHHVTRKGRPDTPRSTRDKLATVDPPHLDSARYSQRSGFF